MERRGRGVTRSSEHPKSGREPERPSTPTMSWRSAQRARQAGVGAGCRTGAREVGRIYGTSTATSASVTPGLGQTRRARSAADSRADPEQQGAAEIRIEEGQRTPAPWATIVAEERRTAGPISSHPSWCRTRGNLAAICEEAETGRPRRSSDSIHALDSAPDPCRSHDRCGVHPQEGRRRRR